MVLGIILTNGHGGGPKRAWRLLDVDPGNYAKIVANIRDAQTAECAAPLGPVRRPPAARPARPALTPQPLTAAHASPTDPRSGHALKVARQGWTIRGIPAHGVIDYHPVTVGPADVHADHLQEWIEAEAADGFWLIPDVYEDGVDVLADQVVPLLRERGLYPTEYLGRALRENLGVPEQYGVDPRMIPRHDS